jgi:hypothetical protein
VLGHQAIGQQPHLRPFDGFQQGFLEGLIILVLEDRHPRIGPIERVVNITAGCRLEGVVP